MEAESRDTVNRSTYIIATLDESFNLYTVLIRDITRYVETVEGGADIFTKIVYARAFVKVVESITELAQCRNFLQSTHGEIFIRSNALRHWLRNATAHSFGSDEAVLASYLASRAFLDSKIRELFTFTYPPFRKRTVAAIKESTGLSFEEYYLSSKYKSPFVKEDPDEPEDDASSILTRASKGLSEVEITPAIRRAIQGLKRQFRDMKLIYPLNKRVDDMSQRIKAVLTAEGHVSSTADLCKPGTALEVPSPELLLTSLQSLQSAEVIEFERVATKLYGLTDEGKVLLRDELFPVRLFRHIKSNKNVHRRDLKEKCRTIVTDKVFSKCLDDLLKGGWIGEGGGRTYYAIAGHMSSADVELTYPALVDIYENGDTESVIESSLLITRGLIQQMVPSFKVSKGRKWAET